MDGAVFPSTAWIGSHGADVLAFARAMRDGRPGLPQIASWHIADPDPAGVDVRIVHELSRMHHWCAYALAAHVESAAAPDWCELLALEIAAFATTWPAEQGTHWAFPMGTGIRAYSMLVAFDWARRTGWVNADAERRVAALAIDHAESLWVRRERRGGLSTSHYAANLLGLLAVARYLPHEPRATQWGTFAACELRRELQRQILDDGMANEASTGYHRQVADIFVHARGLLGEYRTTCGWSEDDDRRLDLAVARCRALEQMGLPLIGDNDDGLAMKLIGFHADCSLMYDVSPSALAADGSMPTFGLYVLEEAGVHVTLRNGPVGQFGKGGHAHQDQNSVTVCVDGAAFIVDPGSSVYTSDVAVRNIERHVSMHATMWWSDLEQAEAPPGEEGLFWLLADLLRCNVTSTEPRRMVAMVTHADGREHRRSIELTDGVLAVQDHCSGGSENVCAWFPLHPNVVVEACAGRTVLLQRNGITCEFSWNAGSLSVDDIHVAPSYGMRVPSRRLVIQGARNLQWTLRRRA